ncbi:Gfo/Idh/MocA family protein [Roseicyclus sp.]|uniref:Gfo/Idh/MocA family protein n=1 Tax=Roseicyclus sp. TaxID=1914329 RepID=UPI003FA14745
MARRVLLIGAGVIARHHAAAAATLGETEILAADPSEAARAAFAAEHPGARLFAEAEEMLSHAPAGPRDIVVVAVPPWLHAPLCLMALERGFHVLCEKPLGRTLAEVDTILEAARRAGRMVGDCAIRFNDQPAMRRAREILASGALGDLTLLRMVNRLQRMRPGVEYQPASRWFLSREAAGGGVVMDWAVYDFAMLFDVLRPVAATVEFARTGGIEGRDDPPDVPIEVESHVVATLTLDLGDGTRLPMLYERANGVNGPNLRELSLEGTRGGLCWQWLPPYEDGMTRITRFVDLGATVSEEVEAMPMAGQPHFHHLPLVALAARIDGGPSPSLDEAGIRFNFATVAALYEAEWSRAPVTVRR